MVNITTHSLTVAQFKALEPWVECAKLGEATKQELQNLDASFEKSGVLPGSDPIMLGRLTSRGKPFILDGRARHKIIVERGLVGDALNHLVIATGNRDELYRLLVQKNAIRRSLPKFMRGIVVVNALADDPDWAVADLATKAQVNESLIRRVIAVKDAGIDGYVESEDIPLERAYQLTQSRNKDLLEGLKDGTLKPRQAYVQVKEREDIRRAESDAKATGKAFTLTDKQVTDLGKGKMDSESLHALMARAQSALARATAAEKAAHEATVNWHNAVIFNGLITRAMRAQGMDPEAILAEASQIMAEHGDAMIAARMAEGLDNIPTVPQTETETDSSVNTDPADGPDVYTDPVEFEQARKRWSDERQAAKPAGYRDLTNSQQKTWRTRYAKENPQPVMATS